ncbi:MAG TPA: hypothetical protein VHW96_07080 [Solirubrobacteraceae bacterium]|nr:hypothetical protein [Solirubrobacteraceae bacterium]
MNDLEITTLITTLSRPHRSGGVVIERAAILAAGADYTTIMDWILAHSGAPEATTPTARSRGIHGSRLNDNASASAQPMRFVLPAGTLD